MLDYIAGEAAWRVIVTIDELMTPWGCGIFFKFMQKIEK